MSENINNKEGSVKSTSDHSAEHQSDRTSEEKLPKPHLGKTSRLSVVAWLIPLLAIGLAAFLVYRSLPAEGLDIRILTENGAGITPQTTLLKYRGVRIGIVSNVELTDSGEAVAIDAKLDHDYRKFAKEQSQFWIVRPEISLSGIDGLDTLVSGPYVTLRPGQGNQKLTFEALPSPPIAEYSGKGLHLQIKTSRLGTLKTGTPIRYRDVNIGKIYDSQLSSTAQNVRLYVYIEAPYTQLIRKNSVFWNASGFDLNVSLFGAKITTESLKGIISGGIAVATPEKPSDPAEEGQIFELLEEQKEEWLKWSPKINIRVEQLDKSL